MRALKALTWLGSSRATVRDFPDDARSVAGFELHLIQAGEEPSDWRPMPTVGVGVREIRVQVGRAFRILYVASFTEAVYVLHAFEKKSSATARRDIVVARTRLRQLIRDRAGR